MFNTTAGIHTVAIAENIGYNVISTAVVVALVWFRDGIFLRLGATFRWIRSRVARRRFVLVWIDDDRSYSLKLIERLAEHEHDRLIYRAIKSPRSLLYYPQSPDRLAGVILLDTDVSKLADDPDVANKIEERLAAFVKSGGGLIGSHDLIYRRARNKKLQDVFGCKLVDFGGYKNEPVSYRLNQPNHPLAADLPANFTLDDGEVCWGDWAADAEIVFTTKDEPRRPLVVCREYPQGRVVWLNSGDRGEQLCPSIAKPEDRFVLLLRNSLRWAGKTT